MDTTYVHQLALGGRLNSNGWGGSLHYSKKGTDGRLTSWQLSLLEIMHEKQVKQEKNISHFPELGPSSPYIYAKTNNLYILNIGYGRQRLLLPSVIEGNISLSLSYSGGLSLALLKPYYLRILGLDYQNGGNVMLQEMRFSETTADQFLDPGNIFGASAWSKGIDETIAVPGAFAELSIAIQPPTSTWFVQTINVGVHGACYTEALPIFALIEAFPWQAQVFAGLTLGKRWK